MEDLSPDYRHLVTQLTELELLRCMDPELLKVTFFTIFIKKEHYKKCKSCSGEES